MTDTFKWFNKNLASFIAFQLIRPAVTYLHSWPNTTLKIQLMACSQQVSNPSEAVPFMPTYQEIIKILTWELREGLAASCIWLRRGRMAYMASASAIMRNITMKLLAEDSGCGRPCVVSRHSLSVQYDWPWRSWGQRSLCKRVRPSFSLKSLSSACCDWFYEFSTAYRIIWLALNLWRVFFMVSP